MEISDKTKYTLTSYLGGVVFFIVFFICLYLLLLIVAIVEDDFGLLLFFLPGVLLFWGAIFLIVYNYWKVELDIKNKQLLIHHLNEKITTVAMDGGSLSIIYLRPITSNTMSYVHYGLILKIISDNFNKEKRFGGIEDKEVKLLFESCGIDMSEPGNCQVDIIFD
jgi:hypothetical protein